MHNNPIIAEVDFSQNGKHWGYLRLPHSVHRSAYGWIPIPVASIKNGKGKTVLIMGGNHGDEYEGQVLVAELFRILQPNMIQGQVILLPMANFPAAQAGLRTSPIDQGNLNRSFPGKPNGQPTEIIAHYIEHELLPRVDYVLDLHSGGSSLIYNGANMLVLKPRNQAEKLKVHQLIQDFGLPSAFFVPANPLTISSAARRQGAISIVAELGGGARVDPKILSQARQGVLHFLGAQSILQGALVPKQPPSKPRLMHVAGDQHYVYARHQGVFVPSACLGSIVQAGQKAGEIHCPARPWDTPYQVTFVGGGEIICQRALAQVEVGDCLFQLAGDEQ